jgi:predicted HicB family RNase H-like nuclease
VTRPPGRPPLDPGDKSVTYTVRLSSRQFDETQREAKEARMTMAEWIRRVLAHDVSHHKNRP